jgi:hypothetical protein
VGDTPRATAGEQPPRDSAQDSGSALYCLSYVSTQSYPMKTADLLAMLEPARDKNARLGITGLLLHRGDSFFQVLEGGREEVESLFATIAADPRHKRVEIVTEGLVAAREYADWQMAFIELEGYDLSALPGFSDVLKDTPAAREFLRSLSRSKKLALLFSVME